MFRRIFIILGIIFTLFIAFELKLLSFYNDQDYENFIRYSKLFTCEPELLGNPQENIYFYQCGSENLIVFQGEEGFFVDNLEERIVDKDCHWQKDLQCISNLYDDLTIEDFPFILAKSFGYTPQL